MGALSKLRGRRGRPAPAVGAVYLDNYEPVEGRIDEGFVRRLIEERASPTVVALAIRAMEQDACEKAQASGIGEARP